jgi:hypothetical protein
MTRRAMWTTVAMVLAMAWPGDAQPQSCPRVLETHPKILFGPARPAFVVNADPERLQLLRKTVGYPLVSVNGHTAVNTLNLGLGHPGNINLAGGAGGLVGNQKSYCRFLDAFVNGGLLGADAQAALDTSYIFRPDLSSPPVIATFNGFGLVKQAVRGLPGVRDLDLYAHNGSLPGAPCEKAAIRRPDPGIVPVTGAFCQNSNGLTSPDPSALLFEFIDMITNANSAQH